MKKLTHGKKLNTNLNRIEYKDKHEYLNEFSETTVQDYDYEGYIKLKLVHMSYGSITIPDQIYMKYREKLLFIQPLFFTPNMLMQNDEDILYTQIIDISCGIKLKINATANNLIKKLDDNSCFYSCTIIGPRHLQNYSTGEAKIINNTPFLNLYHHTDENSKKSIEIGNEFYTSVWNIQGNKKLKNVSFLYLTCIDKIKFKEDLEKIAMSTQGKLAFRCDQNKTRDADLILDVYRASTEERTAILSYWVNTTHLTSQPIYKHTDWMVYYEIVSPFIYRIGSEPNKCISIGDDAILSPNKPKSFDYIIVGDCQTTSGLEAPYDEENTKEILKIEKLDEETEIFRLWFKLSNSERFDSIDVDEKIQFHK